MSSQDSNKNLILASGSAGRKLLLEKAGVEFHIIPSDVDENALKQGMTHLSPEEKALELAKAKAADVSQKHPEAYIIGGDQICSFKDAILDKPGNEENAIKQLTALSGHTHQQISAVCIYKNNECVWSHIDTATLTMRELSNDEIISYVKQDQPFGSCGAFHYESAGKHLFSEVVGSADTIIGMPLAALLTKLKELGVV